MALSEEFEVILKEVVNAKRLSASKMTNLTEIAMKNMEHDTQLVSILYRTHKSLPTTAAKVSSLYVFDALSRAAKHHAAKHSLSGDTFTQPGNAASFLFKVGGVVEGLFQDMIASGSAEAKEKTRKILDIWVKGNTFPSSILSQLSDVLKGTEKVPESKATLTADPRIPSQINYLPPTPAPQSASMAGLDPQTTLLASLTQVIANIPAQQIATNIGSPPQLDAVQLALLQQLAHTAASVPPISQSLPPPESVNVLKFPSSSGVNGSSHTPSLPSFRNEPGIMVKSEQKYSGYRSPESESHPDPHFDEPDNMRGRYRGAYRNRGRGDKFQGRNWDDRDRDRYRDSNRDHSPRTGRGGRSRSRSPPSRYGGRRDSRNYSPPRRTPIAPQYSGERNASNNLDNNEAGKDEFGRDIRPGSPTSHSVVDDNSLPPPPKPTLAHSPPPISPRSPLPVTSDPDINHDQKSVSPLVTSNTSSNKPNARLVTNSISMEPGMENFNLSTFDYTSPASWEALGKMWQVTHGYLPSTEQLMQFVISSGAVQSDSPLETTGQNFGTSPAPPNRGRGTGRGRGGFFRGRGGIMYGNGRMQEGGGRDYDGDSQATDAIVLGGEVQSDDTQYTPFNGAQVPGSQDSRFTHDSSSGRMQRVGDKWVFVRAVAMDVS